MAKIKRQNKKRKEKEDLSLTANCKAFIGGSQSGKTRLMELEIMEAYYLHVLKYTAKQKAQDKRLRNTYGISLAEKEEMLKKQGGVCWICQMMPKSGILCVDHRHIPKYKTLNSTTKRKEVRGLLCFTCNVYLGKLEKRKNARYILERTCEYAKNFKLKGDK